MTLFFAFIKTSSIVLLLSFVVFAFLSTEYLMNFDDSRVTYPDLDNWDGAYLRIGGLNGGTGRNSENGIGAWISRGLVNLGKIGSSKWRFYEYAIDDFGDKNLRAKWGMNWQWAEEYYNITNTTFEDYSDPPANDQDNTFTNADDVSSDQYLDQPANGTVKFGIVRLEQDSTLSFKHHISECNIETKMKEQMIKCNKKVACTIQFTEEWFDTSCWDKYRK
jgi:hypothetical protein